MHRAIAALTLLVACGTPQQQCIARETRDLRVVEGLLAETEANIRRGYALEEVTVWRREWVECPVRYAPGTLEPEPPARPRLCRDDVPDTETRPRAIDLAAEARTRDGLIAKRAELSARAEASIAACRAAYPEEA